MAAGRVRALLTRLFQVRVPVLQGGWLDRVLPLDKLFTTWRCEAALNAAALERTDLRPHC
ncbi:hypothetical protein HMSSN036_49030 [Paenibacillus macerans]|nr:hypothetical protein BK140_22115 [Paenibacillus macerans]GJM72687.1 hypothetical protein HMSSN036_49030 [Paenibacillus macerans]